MPNINTKARAFNLYPDSIEHLDKSAKELGISKNRLVNILIRTIDINDDELKAAIDDDGKSFKDGRGAYDRKEAEKKRVQQAIKEMSKDELAHVLTELTKTED